MTIEERAAVRLTQFAKRAGCAAKHPPGFLVPMLGTLPAPRDPAVIIGSATSDDAAIYRLSDDLALITTTDFFTPIVDDPFDFGRVAATNALSDVYAMGGTPLTALNLVGFPEDGLDPHILGDILRGGAAAAAAAGIDIIGGHTIRTDEPIYGLAVTGRVHPERVISNAGARPGDLLVLTKPLGVGIVTTAAKRDEDTLGAIREAIGLMTTLNAAAARAMIAVGVHAATDVTGFGLLGHLRNILVASDASAELWFDQVPILPAALDYISRDLAPGGTHANWRFLREWVTYDQTVSKGQQLLLADAQTSGGLLIAVAPERAEALVAALEREGTPVAAVIGEITGGEPGRMQVRTTRATDH
ncbi:MAG TPA: selenide, water dikinase SelD [Thermomicrobiales bacterium]|jgi:selenide,water dikinase